jgi:hypothetical protein
VLGSGPEVERRESVVVLELRCSTPDILRKRFELRFEAVVLERVGGKNSAGGERGGELGPRLERRALKMVEQGVKGFVEMGP